MAQYGEWSRKGVTLSHVTARKQYGVGEEYLRSWQAKTELRDITREIAELRKRLGELEARRAQIEARD